MGRQLCLGRLVRTVDGLLPKSFGQRRAGSDLARNWKFESISLQRRVCELSVPLLSRPEGDVRGIGFQTVRTYIAIGNSEARGAMLARTIFGVAENSQAYRGPRATKLESTVRYLGIEVDDALSISEQVEL